MVARDRESKKNPKTVCVFWGGGCIKSSGCEMDDCGCQQTKIAAWMLFLLVSDTPYIEMKGWHCTKSGYCQKDAVFLK